MCSSLETWFSGDLRSSVSFTEPVLHVNLTNYYFKTVVVAIIIVVAAVGITLEDSFGAVWTHANSMLRYSFVDKSASQRTTIQFKSWIDDKLKLTRWLVILFHCSTSLACLLVVLLEFFQIVNHSSYLSGGQGELDEQVTWIAYSRRALMKH